MNLLFWGLTIGVIGKVMLAVAVLRAHVAILHEHKIDGVVLNEIKRERWITIIGLIFILIGYVCELTFYGYTPMLTCTSDECAAAAGALLQ